MKHIPPLPTYPESLWIQSIDQLPSFSKLQKDIEADVTVVGGGIAGITTAYRLTQAGLKVVLLEAGKLLHGTTGHTTAKLTAQHHLIYDELIKQEGKEKAALYYKANQDARKYIESLIQQYSIDCGFQAQDAYIFTNSEEYIQKLQNEISAYETLGISGAILDRIPLDVPAKAAVRMDGQSQFHPLQYMTTLIKMINLSGGHLYEQSTAIDIQEGSSPKVLTADGYSVTCKHVVICSHFPFYDGYGLYFDTCTRSVLTHLASRPIWLILAACILARKNRLVPYVAQRLRTERHCSSLGGRITKLDKVFVRFNIMKHCNNTLHNISMRRISFIAGLRKTWSLETSCHISVELLRHPLISI